MKKKYYFAYKDNRFEFESAVDCAEFFRDKFEFESKFEKHIDQEWGNIEILNYIFPSSIVLKTILDDKDWKASLEDYVNNYIESIVYELEDMSDVETKEYFGVTVYCDYINEGNDFTNDWEKMYDFFLLNKSDFLETYNYLTEDDYNATKEIVNKSETSFSERCFVPIHKIINVIANERR